MPDPLLITKLHSPKFSAQSIARPRLTGLVNDALQAGRPLTLVSAPPGFGKTSLLSEWISQGEWHATWLGLDEEDNDPARFWAYFIAALQVLREDLGANAQAVLKERESLAAPDEPLLTVLLNEIAAFPQSFVLVLDDYHLINTPAIHNGLTFMIDHIPRQMHMILAGRSDPPLPLARWRAGGRLAEIRAADLRFTKEEAASFMIETVGLPLSSDEVSALVDRTEGWIAGLQLASIALQATAAQTTAPQVTAPQSHLSMHSRQDIPTFIADFTGSNHYIVDYLTEEILQRQTEPVQSFLLRTSILERLCGPLCEAVTGQPGGQEMLERLERANLFLQRLDDERQWYRYHQLFAETLRQRLRLAQPALIPELQHKASKWYEQNGMAAEAIRHALAGKDFERAADLVEANATNIHWRRGEVGTLLIWLEALPDELVRRRPRLCLLHAWALLLSGRFAAVESRLEDLEKFMLQEHAGGTETVEIQGLRGQVAAIRARLARIHNDLPGSIELCHQALEFLPSEDVYLRGVISLNLGLAYWQSGDIAAASRVLAETSTINEPGSMLSTSLVAQAFLADLQAEQGHLHQAARLYQQAIEQAEQSQGSPAPIAAWACIGMGKVLYQWNDLDAAGRYIEKGLELARRWGAADGLAWGYLHLAQWKAAYMVPEEAETALSQAEHIVQQSRVAPWTAAEVVGYRGRLWISQGNISAAGLWAQEHGLEAGDEISYQQLPEYMSLARLLMVQSRFEEMDRLQERMLHLAESLGLTGRVIEILTLRAFAFQAQGKTDRADEVLKRVLALAEPEGYYRLFLDEGVRMKVLLEQHLWHRSPKSSGPEHSYAAGLLASLTSRENGETKIHSTTQEAGALADPLSQRELEILSLLAEGLSNQEIARRTYISTGTVKVHLKHIFRKLEVGNRTEAAARARQLSLI